MYPLVLCSFTFVRMIHFLHSESDILLQVLLYWIKWPFTRMRMHEDLFHSPLGFFFLPQCSSLSTQKKKNKQGNVKIDFMFVFF